MSQLQGQSGRYQSDIDFVPRSLGSRISPAVGAYSHSQNKAILIVGLVCAIFSLIAAFVALRWFLLMRRAFRHRLVLFLIVSDSFKAVWYFVFPIVVFAAGPVDSSSGFCQASGFFLLLAIEASDFAILLIALHAILYIFRPISKAGEGGLYPWRKWIVPFWLGPPVLLASLAFINHDNGYVASGNFCYLPKRPFWYRLALSWIPRYIIIGTIFLMYASIYIYVHFKFRGFTNLATADVSYGSGSNSRNQSSRVGGLDVTLSPMKLADENSETSTSPASEKQSSDNSTPQWNTVSFTTPSSGQTLQASAGQQTTASVLTCPLNLTIQGDSRIPQRQMSVVPEGDEESLEESRKPSQVPTVNTSFTGETARAPPSIEANTTPEAIGVTDPLHRTRMAIQRQLRFLFIYPIIYVLMWAFPFASHALTYSDHYVMHPPFWLSVTQTLMLALQAGVDCVVFSWREKPWRRIDENSPFSLPFIRRQSVALIHKVRKKSDAQQPQPEITPPPPVRLANPNRNAHWWEAEGRLRKDSIWMGTDGISKITSRKETGDLRTQTSHETIPV